MIIQDAHGNYSATSRPTWFASRNVLLKLSMQFRYYSQTTLGEMSPSSYRVRPE